METGTQQSSILMLTREHDDDASPQPAGILPSTNATDPLASPAWRRRYTQATTVCLAWLNAAKLG